MPEQSTYLRSWFLGIGGPKLRSAASLVKPEIQHLGGHVEEESDAHMLRANEFRLLVDWATSGAESALVLVGGTGSGKSAMLRAVANFIGEKAVIIGANEAERSWPGSGLSNLLTSIDIPGLAALADEANDLSPTESHKLARVAVSALRAAEVDSLRVFLNRADLLDKESQAIIGFIARRLRGTGLHILLAVRSLPPEGHFEGIQILELAPLSRKEMQEFFRTLPHPPIPAAIVDAVIDASHGLPDLAAEIIKGLGPGCLEGNDALTLPFVPGPIATTLAAEATKSADMECRQLLEALSTAPVMFVDEVTELMTHPPRAVAALLAAGIVTRRGDRLTIAHAAVRSSVYWTMTLEERQRLHRSFSSALPSGTPMQCWHRSFTDFSPEAVTSLKSASLTAIQSGEENLAVELLERSLLLRVPNDADCGLILAIANSFCHLGNFAAAERYVEIADAVATSAVNRVNITTLRIRLEYLSMQVVLTALAADTISRFGAEAPTETAMLLALLAIYRAERWELAAADEFLDQADALLPFADEASRTVAESARILTGNMSGRDRRDRDSQPSFSSKMMGSGPIATTAMMTRGRAFTFAERYEDARGVFDMILSSHRKIEPLWIATTRAYSVENDRLASNFHGAMATIEIMLKDENIPHIHQPFRAYLESWYWAERGSEDLYNEALERVYRLNHGRRNASVSARVDAYQGARALHQGHFDTAVRLLMRSRVVCAAVRNPQLYRSDPDLVEALVRSGDRATAIIVAEDFSQRATQAPSRWSTMALGRCRALLAEDTKAMNEFSKLVAAHSAQDLDYEQARTLTAYAGHLAEAGMLSESLRLRREASELYLRMGLPWWSNVLKRADEAATIQSVDMSPAEWEVANLVLAGKRNREIAAALFVTVRAVESRLTALYRKLGVRSRTELITKLDSSGRT